MGGDTSVQDTLFILQDTIQKLEHFNLTRYTNTAACALVIYDLLLTVDDTVRHPLYPLAYILFDRVTDLLRPKRFAMYGRQNFHYQKVTDRDD
jgi:hypothetical protein